MKVIADTNVLLRITVRDDPPQEVAATAALRDAELISITLPLFVNFAGFCREPIAFHRNALLRQCAAGWMSQGSPPADPQSKQDFRCWMPAATLPMGS